MPAPFAKGDNVTVAINPAAPGTTYPAVITDVVFDTSTQTWTVEFNAVADTDPDGVAVYDLANQPLPFNPVITFVSSGGGTVIDCADVAACIGDPLNPATCDAIMGCVGEHTGGGICFEPLSGNIGVCLSTDPNNCATFGTDEGLYVPCADSVIGCAEVMACVVDNLNGGICSTPDNKIGVCLSEDPNNCAVFGTDSGIYVPCPGQIRVGVNNFNTSAIPPVSGVPFQVLFSDIEFNDGFSVNPDSSITVLTDGMYQVFGYGENLSDGNAILVGDRVVEIYIDGAPATPSLRAAAMNQTGISGDESWAGNISRLVMLTAGQVVTILVSSTATDGAINFGAQLQLLKVG